MPGHLSTVSTAALSRMMLRHTRFIARQTTRRHASNIEVAKDTAAKSKETASNATSKSSEGLSKVTSSAGSAVSGAAQRVSKAVGNIGGRTGRMISFVQCESRPTNLSQDRSASQLRHLELYPCINGSLYLWTTAQFLLFFEHPYTSIFMSSM